MRRILIVLDSLRHDSYVLSDTSLIDESIGKPSKAYTNCNYTPASFLMFLGQNKLPYPNPLGKWKLDWFNFPGHLKRNGTKIHFFTGIPWLEKHNHAGDILRGVFEYFDTHHHYNAHDCLDDMIRDFKRLPKNALEDCYVVFWLGETHYPYSFNGTVTDGIGNWVWSKPDQITDADYKYFQKRQIQACEWSLRRLYDEVLCDWDGEVIITSDHGESLGESSPIDGVRVYGHSNDPGIIQYTVPFVARLDG